MNMTRRLQDTMDKVGRGQASIDDVIDELHRGLQADGYEVSREAVRETILGDRGKLDQIHQRRDQRRQNTQQRQQQRRQESRQQKSEQLDLFGGMDPKTKGIVENDMKRREMIPGEPTAKGQKRGWYDMAIEDPVYREMGVIAGWALIKLPKALGLGAKDFGQFVWDQIKTVDASDEYYPGARTFGGERTYKALEGGVKRDYKNWKFFFGQERGKAVGAMLKARREYGEESEAFKRASRRIVMLDRMNALRGGPGLSQLIMDDFMTRYGSWEKFLDTLENRPDQIITDLAMLPWLKGTKVGRILQRADMENLPETLGMARRALLNPDAGGGQTIDDISVAGAVESLRTRADGLMFNTDMLNDFIITARGNRITDAALVQILTDPLFTPDVMDAHLNSMAQYALLDPTLLPTGISLRDLSSRPVRALGHAVEMVEHYRQNINPDTLVEYEDLARIHANAGHSHMGDHVNFLMSDELTQSALEGRLAELQGMDAWTPNQSVLSAIESYRAFRPDINDDPALLDYFARLTAEYGVPKASILRFLLDPNMTRAKINDAMEGIIAGQGLIAGAYRGTEIGRSYIEGIKPLVLDLNPNVTGGRLDHFLRMLDYVNEGDPGRIDYGDVLEVLADGNLNDSLLDYNARSLRDFGSLDELMVPWASSDTPDWAVPPAQRAPDADITGADDAPKVHGEGDLELTPEQKQEVDDFLAEMTKTLAENGVIKESDITPGGEFWNMFQEWKKDRYKLKPVEEIGAGERFPKPTTEKIAMPENQFDEQISDDFYKNSQIKPSANVSKTFDEYTIKNAIKMIEYNRSRAKEGYGDLQSPKARSEYRFEAYERDNIGYGDHMGYYTLYVHGNELRMRRTGGYE